MMSATAHSRQFDNICRTCSVEKKSMKSLFDTDCSLGQVLQLFEMLMACTTVDVQEDDGLPAQICLSCIDSITRSFAFKKLCEDSDSTLREVLRKSTITDDEPLIEMKPPANVALCSQGTVADIDTDMLDIKDIKMKFEEDETNIGDLRSVGTESMDCEDNKITMISAHEPKPQNVQPVSNEDTKLDTENAPLPDEIEPSNYRCEECSACFTLEDDLKIHAYTHRKSTKYVCKVCNKDCVTAQSLYKHAKVHRAKTYVCTSCGRGFKRADGLKRHLKTHTDNSSSFVCYSCGEEFVDSSTLIAHARTHPDETERSVEQPRRKKNTQTFTCTICGEKFTTTRSLSVHMKKHTIVPNLICSYCGKAFTQYPHLVVHERIHRGERPYKCNVCNKDFVTNSNLKVHLRTHSGEKPYVCKVCGNDFATSHQLLLHMRTHTGERPYKCQLCPKAFVRLADLRLHTQVHTGERNHICEYCQRGFYRADILKIHVATHTGVRPYKCHICDSSYAIENRLKQHLKKH